MTKNQFLKDTQAAYVTTEGAAYCGDSLELQQIPDNSVQLVMTSPAFALQRQKEYGNAKLPEFFIRFLSEPGDLVVDIFAGNTTGQVAEMENRQWLAFENNIEYFAASAFRFLTKNNQPEVIQTIYNQIRDGKRVDLTEYQLNKASKITAIAKPETYIPASLL